MGEIEITLNYLDQTESWVITNMEITQKLSYNKLIKQLCKYIKQKPGSLLEISFVSKGRHSSKVLFATHYSEEH